MAKSLPSKAVEKVAKGSADTLDWDVPLSETQEKSRAAEFKTCYPLLEFDSESVPASPLVGRAYRELRDTKRQLSILSLRKMRSVTEFQHLSPDITKQLADGSRSAGRTSLDCRTLASKRYYI